MLRHIHVRNFAIIDSIQLELAGGLTVMTGETGAGKSILVDALGLLLGDRAGADTIRPGSERAELEALFTLENQPQAQDKLKELALDDESGECLLRRVIAREGASRAFISRLPSPSAVGWSSADARKVGNGCSSSPSSPVPFQPILSLRESGR